MERKVKFPEIKQQHYAESRIGQFLNSCKTASLTLQSLEPTVMIKIVIGNETMDLDSVACTIGYAHLLHQELDNDTDIVLPVMNMKVQDMRLKTELNHYIKKFGFNPDVLIFRDDVLPQLLKLEKTQLQVILVDHHVNATLKPYVVEIIDHRPQEFDWTPFNIKITLLPVGSCASLVLKKIFERSVSNAATLYPEALEMLYGAILLDTNNMSLETLRFTNTDTDMVAAFEKLAFWQGKQVSRDTYYAELLNARNDVSELSAMQRLRKDVKDVGTLPICVLTTLVQDFCGVQGAADALKNYCHLRKTKNLVLMGIQHIDKHVTRDMGFYASSSPAEINAIIEGLMASENPKLNLERIHNPTNFIPGLSVYNQRNLCVTRKMATPIIRRIVSNFPRARESTAGPNLPV